MTPEQARVVKLATQALREQLQWWGDHFGDIHPDDQGLHRVTIDIWSPRWVNTRKALNELEKAFKK